MSKEDQIIPRSKDFNEWYNTIVLRADMADYGPVRGTMIVKPYGWSLWENIQGALDRRFKATGIENAAFPMFIPMSFLEKEAHHIEGFAPELAVVTHGGGQELSEPLAVRPTSETTIGNAYSKWIQSHRDLPVLINLWNSVVRWELHTKLFLRTLEFYWQEGHTAHASEEEAWERTKLMLDIYADFAISEAAIPVIAGEKTDSEKFAGAQRTLTIEAMMGDGKALQSGTSHYLGQNFAKAFEIKFLDVDNIHKYCHTTSWGLSTRFIGAIIMTHGDDKGLVLPPRLAPYQTVIIPIYKTDEEKQPVMEAVDLVQKQLIEAGIRVKVDKRSNLTAGYKFNDWELRGVPIRIEIGPKDVKNNSAAVARRDILGREGKQILSRENLIEKVKLLLIEIQNNLLAKATKFRDDNTVKVNNYNEFKSSVEKGFISVWWAGDGNDEAKIKEETKATIRCIPFDQPDGKGKCFYTGKPADKIAIFARSY